jgi:hypothetical protein
MLVGPGMQKREERRSDPGQERSIKEGEGMYIGIGTVLLILVIVLLIWLL